jgi:hypothetical protein
MNWYAPLQALDSLGRSATRPGSLAGLAAARASHRGQFFTPGPIGAVMWRIVAPAMDAYLAADPSGRDHVRLFDNSAGSGRLFQFADPKRHVLYGVDTDAATLAELARVAQAAGFICTFESTGLENLDPDGFHVGLINPPFSLHIESPHLHPYPCTAYGRYGPHTSTVSHAYALAQAVDACDVVVALLPATFAAEVAAAPQEFLPEREASRLCAHIGLPGGLFREENTDVRVALLVFDRYPLEGEIVSCKLESLTDPLPALSLSLSGKHGAGQLRVRGIVDEGPTIHLPVTNDTRVRIGHSGRKVGMRFFCGLTEAKVRNTVLCSRMPPVEGGGTPRPKGVVYEGQGVLDLEVHLAQPDPLASFQRLLDAITEAGGTPEVDPGLWAYLRKAVRRTARQACPMRHVAYLPDGAIDNERDVFEARALRTRPTDRSAWVSPIVKEGDAVTFTRTEGGRYRFTAGGKDFEISAEELAKDFAGTSGKSGWIVVHEGMKKAFPALYAATEKRARALGIDSWLSWDFQFADLIECAIKPRGAVVAWDMALGKGRLSAALVLLRGCRHGLIVTEAGLVPELVAELQGLPIPAELWQVIETPEDLKALRRINVISYERLRLPLYTVTRSTLTGSDVTCVQDGGTDVDGASKSVTDTYRAHFTYAHRLRRRCGVLVADEASALANPESDRSRAVAQVSAPVRYSLSGTPAPNHAFDIVPVLAQTVGDGTASQPWGWRQGKLEPHWRHGMLHATRGKEAVREAFCVFDWVTKEYFESLDSGAKRLIPGIRNVDKYRAMLSPHVLRRVQTEPEVRKYVKIDPPEHQYTEIEWDDSHLAWFVEIAEDFAAWYRQTFNGGRGDNLGVILKRIRAVSYAGDFPQHGVAGFGSYARWTSKQRWVLDLAESLALDGSKSIVYAEHPELLELYHAELTRRGIPCLTYHGGHTITSRTRKLNQRFRNGDDMVLLASLGITQRGLNLPQAHRGIMGSRMWLNTMERQAIYRMCRPQQQRKVVVDYGHLPGSLDIYKHQMVSYKADAERAGLDWGTPTMQEGEFLHLTTIIYRFVQDIARLRNIEPRALREALKSSGRTGKEACYA